jgi:hypothetical protein
VFVAGRRLQGNTGQSEPFELLMAAPYRWLPVGSARAIRIDGAPMAPGEVRFLRAEPHAATFDADGTRGVLVLALAEPPERDAPLAFYKTY